MIIRKRKKPTVQLTSLLDLLFIMIFISLLQSKEMPVAVAEIEAQPAPVVESPVPKTVVPPEPIERAVTALFHFYSTAENPNLPSGKFNMKGTFNRNTGALHLQGTQWAQRPQGYDMVPLSGAVTDGGKRFVGRIEFPGCEEFTLVRTTQGEGIRGTWEGSYICSQGVTGLSLSVE